MCTSIQDKDYKDEVESLIQNCAYALRAGMQAHFSYSAYQLVFGVDIIFRQRVIIDWEKIKSIRHNQAKADNKKGNKK